MPAAQSKLASNDDTVVRRKLRLIWWHMFFNIFTSLMVSASRLHILKQLQPRTTPKDLNRTMTYWIAAITAIEFLFQPTFGKLSDAIGRKCFFVMAPLANLVLKTWMALAPSKLALGAEMVVGDGLRVLGTTMVLSATSDVTTDQAKLAGNLASVSAAAGSAVILASLSGGQLAKGGNLLVPYYASAVMSLFLVALDLFAVEETLPQERRRPFGGYVNPLAFVRLFTTGNSTFSTLSVVQGLTYCVETKNVANPQGQYCLNQLALDATSSARVASAVGVSMIAQAPLSAKLIPKLGIAGFATVANLATFVGYSLRGSVQTLAAMYAGILVNFVGEGRGACNKARCVKLVEQVGMGLGEMNGLHANLRAVCGLAVTFLYSWAYELFPRAPFLIIAVTGLVTEAVCRRLPRPPPPKKE